MCTCCVPETLSLGLGSFQFLHIKKVLSKFFPEVFPHPYKYSEDFVFLTHFPAKDYFSFLTILYPMAEMKIDIRGDMILKKQYGR